MTDLVEDGRHGLRLHRQYDRLRVADEVADGDLGGVSYIDSSGIASLVEGFQTAKSAKLEYGLLNISKTAMQVLTLTRLDKVFQLYTSAADFEKAL